MSFGKGVALSGPRMKPRFMRRAQVVTRRPPVRREIRNVKRSIKKIQRNVEVKYVDTSVNAVISGNATLALLNGLQTGDTDNTRSGNMVQATSISLRGWVQRTGTTGTSGAFRLLLFWDQQANQTAPTSDDVITTPHLYSQYNRDNQKRFKILYDKVFTIHPQYTSQLMFHPLIIKRKLSRQVKYDDGNVGDITDITTNSLYYMLITDSAAVGDFTHRWSARFNFKDA